MDDLHTINFEDMGPLNWSHTIASAWGAGVNKKLMIVGVGLDAEYQVHSSGACIYTGFDFQLAVEAYNDPR